MIFSTVALSLAAPISLMPKSATAKTAFWSRESRSLARAAYAVFLIKSVATTLSLANLAADSMLLILFNAS